MKKFMLNVILCGFAIFLNGCGKDSAGKPDLSTIKDYKTIRRELAKENNQKLINMVKEIDQDISELFSSTGIKFVIIPTGNNSNKAEIDYSSLLNKRINKLFYVENIGYEEIHIKDHLKTRLMDLEKKLWKWRDLHSIALGDLKYEDTKDCINKEYVTPNRNDLGLILSALIDVNVYDFDNQPKFYNRLLGKTRSFYDICRAGPYAPTVSAPPEGNENHPSELALIDLIRKGNNLDNADCNSLFEIMKNTIILDLNISNGFKGKISTGSLRGMGVESLSITSQEHGVVLSLDGLQFTKDLRSLVLKNVLVEDLASLANLKDLTNLEIDYPELKKYLKNCPVNSSNDTVNNFCKDLGFSSLRPRN